MKNLVLILFLVRVSIPMGTTLIIRNVLSYVVGLNNGQSIKLVLTDGKEVIVPTMWTVIEEK